VQAGEREDGGGGWCVDVGVGSEGGLVAGIVKMSFDFIRRRSLTDPYLNRVIPDSPLVSLDISLEINSRHESKGMSRRSSIPQFKYGVEVLATRRVEDPRENIALEPSHPRLTPRFVGCQILQLDSLHESKGMSRGCVDEFKCDVLVLASRTK
jgi:hypothetical protein